MSQTYFRIEKDSFSVIRRSLKQSLEDGKFDCYDEEIAEYLIKEIADKILYNHTSRKNYQVIDYNDPSYSQSSGRAQYDHYGTYPILEEVKYPHEHTMGNYS